MTSPTTTPGIYQRPASVTEERWAAVLAHAKRHEDEGLVDNDVSLLLRLLDVEQRQVRDVEQIARNTFIVAASGLKMPLLNRDDAKRAAEYLDSMGREWADGAPPWVPPDVAEQMDRALQTALRILPNEKDNPTNWRARVDIATAREAYEKAKKR